MNTAELVEGSEYNCDVVVTNEETVDMDGEEAIGFHFSVEIHDLTDYHYFQYIVTDEEGNGTVHTWDSRMFEDIMDELGISDEIISLPTSYDSNLKSDF